MSNVKHPKCAIRNMANDAKQRLTKNDYTYISGAMAPPRDVTPSQREIYIKLVEFLEHGEEVVNPIRQLADPKKLSALGHDERQRYILQLSADYLTMKKALNENLIKSGAEKLG